MVAGIAGVIMVVTGVVLVTASVLKGVVHEKVEQEVALVNGSASYNAWLDPPAPVYIEFRLFSCVNPKEVLKNGSKPIVVEKGPYTYREIRPKRNVSFHKDGEEISYVQPKSYVFVPDKSSGSPNDNVTVINFPILTAAYEVQYQSYFVRIGLKELLKLYKEELFETRTVGEILWGYEDPVLKLMKRFVPSTPSVVGLFSGPTANGTDDGEYTVCSGVKNASELAQIKAWNGKSSVSYWNDRYGNQINGTDGSLWHPFAKKDDKFYVFSSDVCRSIYARYDRTVHMEGIELYRFVVPRDVLASAKENPDNRAFCTPNCLDTGVINITRCKDGAPVIMSLPHFLNAAPRYINAVGGMHPQADKHETQLDVEPITGAVLHAAKRLQFNFYVKAVDSFSGTEMMNDTIYPLLWVTETASINSTLASDFKKKVYMPMEVASDAPYGLIGFGVALVIIAVVIAVIRKLRRNQPGLSVQADPLISE